METFLLIIPSLSNKQAYTCFLFLHLAYCIWSSAVLWLFQEALLLSIPRALARGLFIHRFESHSDEL